MKPINRSTVTRAVLGLLEITSARKATVYQSPTAVAKATRQRRHDKRCNSETIIVTVGAPNFAERKFIKLCQKAGEPFPIRKTVLKFFPTKKPVKKKTTRRR